MNPWVRPDEAIHLAKSIIDVAGKMPLRDDQLMILAHTLLAGNQADGFTLEEVHQAISRSLAEAGIKNEVQRGQCIIAGLESLPE